MRQGAAAFEGKRSPGGCHPTTSLAKGEPRAAGPAAPTVPETVNQ